VDGTTGHRTGLRAIHILVVAGAGATLCQACRAKRWRGLNASRRGVSGRAGAEIARNGAFGAGGGAGPRWPMVWRRLTAARWVEALRLAKCLAAVRDARQESGGRDGLLRRPGWSGARRQSLLGAGQRGGTSGRSARPSRPTSRATVAAGRRSAPGRNFAPSRSDAGSVGHGALLRSRSPSWATASARLRPRSGPCAGHNPRPDRG
jgi:hypothetical protein